MKKWLIYVLGIVTGIVLTFGVAFCIRMSNNSGIIGLELFEEPSDCKVCNSCYQTNPKYDICEHHQLQFNILDGLITALTNDRTFI